jgi:hypothetical protein
MNGRLYDPKLHRFLQPDNYVQDPSNTQNYNRYSYVLNNPLKYTDPSGEKWKITWSDIVSGLAVVVGTVLLFTPAAVLGGALIAAGANHFVQTIKEYSQTGDWVSASNNAGFVVSYSQRVDWLDGSTKTDVNGVTQNAPVVTPKTVEQVKQDKGNGGGGQGDGFEEHLTGVGNLLTGFGTYLATLEKAAYANATYIYKYGTQTASAAQLTLQNKEFQLAVAEWAPVVGKYVGWAGAGISVRQYIRGDIGGWELGADIGATYIGTRGGWWTVAGIS